MNNSLGKIIGIVFGSILLAALVFFIVPRISPGVNSMPTVQATDDLEQSVGVKLFRDFQSDLNASTQYSFCATKRVTGKDADFELYFVCTIRGDDYVIKTVSGNQERRQLYIDGKNTYINDNEKLVYQNVHEIDFPDTHFQEALTGKVINAYGEIIDGYQANCVELYKNGMVYAVYFDQNGELLRFYYIYDGNEVKLDFCGFFFGKNESSASFDVPSLYRTGIWNPSDMNQ